ncbi:peptidylprolyl isomerase [Mucilaginibacter robiniae]|uniref:Peptidylprolyl isomerase n=1 Tax=Mucilaginibacter robiniae TaxID=2728022 RepID=A0A7L5E4X3_9SPHI|nr:peptidylprolyl isomerase [Mucilaginibacter robiniae]QJD95366.1 peptidylprolyl isomerase [Mucilaginibacter robiniae]
MRKITYLFFSFILIALTASAQKQTLDKVAGVVGGSIVLQSDIESTYAQYLSSGMQPDPAAKCTILQRLIVQKLLAQQAVIDSVTVNEDDVDAEVDRRMRAMIRNAGSQERLEQFLGRSVVQYKDEIRPDIKEQLVANKMQGKITEKVSVTPQEVERFFNKIPKDSLPSYNKEVEVAQIMFQPKLNKEEKAYYKQKAEDLRTRIKNGEDFGTLARLYSQDPGTAPSGGELGFQDRSSGLATEYAAMAFKLKAGELSPVFETDFGFHFLQVIERRGEQVNTRHILIMPTTTPASIERAKSKADSIYNLVTLNKNIDFASAASFYSDDKETKYNGGMMMNYEDVQSRSTIIPTDKLDPQVALVVDTMKVGEVSKPQLITGQDGKSTYRIFYLRSVTNAHKANLAQDFPRIKDLAQSDKVNRTVSEWFEKKRKDNFIRIDPEFQSCPQLKGWNSTSVAAQVTATKSDEK